MIGAYSPIHARAGRKLPAHPDRPGAALRAIDQHPLPAHRQPVGQPLPVHPDPGGGRPAAMPALHRPESGACRAGGRPRPLPPDELTLQRLGTVQPAADASRPLRQAGAQRARPPVRRPTGHCFARQWKKQRSRTSALRSTRVSRWAMGASWKRSSA